MIWSVFYAASYHIIKPLIFKEEISIFELVSAIFNGHYHMWFLFALIGLYLITPILRMFIKRDNLPLITAYLNFSVVVCFVVPFVNQIINMYTAHENILETYISNYQMNYFYDSIVYYIMGWYILNKKIEKRSRIIIYICGFLSYLGTVVCTQLFYDNTLSPINFFYNNNCLTVFLYSVAVLTFLHNLLKRKNYTASDTVLKLSSYVFGVYLIHPVFLFLLKPIFRNISPAPLGTVIIFLSTTFLSFFSVFIISKIPLIRKVVRI